MAGLWLCVFRYHRCVSSPSFVFPPQHAHRLERPITETAHRANRSDWQATRPMGGRKRGIGRIVGQAANDAAWPTIINMTYKEVQFSSFDCLWSLTLFCSYFIAILLLCYVFTWLFTLLGHQNFPKVGKTGFIFFSYFSFERQKIKILQWKPVIFAKIMIVHSSLKCRE